MSQENEKDGNKEEIAFKVKEDGENRQICPKFHK